MRPHAHISPSCRQLLSYITKDKQTESLVEKLCQRFRTARYTGPWRIFGQRGALTGKEPPRASLGLWASDEEGGTFASCVLLPLTEPFLAAELSGSTGTWPTACCSCPSPSEASAKCWTILTALAINCQMSPSSLLFCRLWANCSVGPSPRARYAAPASFRTGRAFCGF